MTSWIKKIKRNYRYVCPSGHEAYVTMLSGDEHPASVPCVECGAEAALSGFSPAKMEQTTFVEYVQNGRKAYRIIEKDGTVKHISKSKMHYGRTGRVAHFYSDDYNEKLSKEGETYHLEDDLIVDRKTLKRGTASQEKYEHNQ